MDTVIAWPVCGTADVIVDRDGEIVRTNVYDVDMPDWATAD